MYCGGHELLGSHPFITFAVGLFTASMMVCWTSTLHEAAHHTLFKRRWLNVWIGRWIGSMMFIPYSAYRETHIRHHAYLNQPRDWELWPYSDPTKSLTFRRIYAWFDLISGVVSSAIIYGRIFFHRKSPIANHAVRTTIRGEYWGLLAIWTAIFVSIYLTNSWHIHLRGTLWPIMLAGTLQTLRKFTEHLGMSSFDPLLGTRTVIPHRLWLRIASFFNFDIIVHGPHHRHPRAAHTSLKRRMTDYVDAQRSTRFPVYDRYWLAAFDMFPHFLFNPGCGINVGATPPTNLVADVDDFPTDVVLDIPQIPPSGTNQEKDGRIMPSHSPPLTESPETIHR